MLNFIVIKSRSKKAIAQVIKTNYSLFPDKQFRGKTKLVKMLYLLEKERKIKTGLKFKLHHYGPYSDDIDKILINLEKEGYIKTQKGKKFDYTEISYIPTKKLLSEDLGLTKNEIKNIESLERKYRSLSASELSNYIYEVYITKKKTPVEVLLKKN